MERIAERAHRESGGPQYSNVPFSYSLQVRSQWHEAFQFSRVPSPMLEFC